MNSPDHSQVQPDKHQVRASFASAADQYDEVAVLQHEVADRMLERLDLVLLQPQRILDVGCGTGRATIKLTQRYKKAQVIALDLAEPMLLKTREKLKATEKIPFFKKFGRIRLLCADAEQLPLADQSVDMLFSNLTIQWCRDIEATMAEFHRVLRPGGLLMFSTLGPDTLHELRASWAAADARVHVNEFLDLHDVGDAALRAGLADPVMDAERITLTYNAANDLMRDLKVIGAHNVNSGRNQGLTGKGRFAAVAEAYEHYRVDGCLPATYEVIYGHAWRAEAKSSQIEVQFESGISHDKSQ